MPLSRLACALLVALSLPLAARAEVPAPQDMPYAPGTIRIEVDATNLAQRIFQVRETLPVAAGELTLLYPQWIPGNHGPRGPIEKLAGLTFTANGRKLAWKRDPLNVYAFHVTVPEGASTLVAEYQYLSPTDGVPGGVAMAPQMLNLKWNTVLLYPAGHFSSKIDYSASVKYPAGWKAATALDIASTGGDTVDYQTVPLEVLADSPVFAGRHYKLVDLAPGAKVPIRLNVFADKPGQLEAKPEHLKQHVELATQALKLFGAQHYDHYDFLFSLSEQMGGNGLEHQRSSENGVGIDYFTDWDGKTGSTDLLAHEFVHSWNGKYRRGADLATPNYNVPIQDSLMWVYEGQTQYWGNVLAARSGLRPLPASRDAWAMVAATYADNRPGLGWRSVQDTTNDPVITARAPKSYRSWQMSEDYYSAGQMIWLEADALIRAKTGNRKSLDDFAKAFFGVDDGKWESPNTYTFEDVVATLNGVVANDWATFLRDRLDGKTGLTGGIEASGWKLVYKDEPSPYAKAQSKSGRGAGTADFVYSLGLSIDKGGKVADVRWDSPAFNAGIGSGTQIVAVDEVEYSKDALEDAVKAAKDGKQPIVLMVKEFDRYRRIPVDYHGGLRYPHLERIEGKPDYLTPISSPRK